MTVHEGSLPVAPPTVARDAEEARLLLQFVYERDVRCPRCDYNLRCLTQPICPECHEELRLVVGTRKIRFGLLIAALAPGIFSGISAAFLGFMLFVVMPRSPNASAPWFVYATDAFGWISAGFTLLLFLSRDHFLRMSVERQRAWAAIIWVAHVAYTLFLVIVMF